MAQSLRKRQKIVILFTLGIGCPSLILGYLAFRGIQNDQALMEKEQLTEHRFMARQIAESIADSMKTVETVLLQTLTFPERTTASLADDIKKLKVLFPSIEEVFSYDETQDILFCTAKLLYLGEASYFSSITQYTLTTQTIRQAQRLEFEQQNYNEALRMYQQAFAEGSDRSVKGEILNHIARVQKKAGLVRDAIRTYQTILQDYCSEQSENGLPLALTAGLELGAIHTGRMDTLQALEAYLNACQGLLETRWILNRSQYVFYSGKICEAVESLLTRDQGNGRFPDQKRRWIEFKQKSEELGNMTERLLMFQAQFPDRFGADIRTSSLDSLSVWQRFNWGIGDQQFLISLHDRLGGNTCWGILFQPDSLSKHLIQKAVLSIVPDEQTGWIVRDKDGQVMLSSVHKNPGLMTVQTGFHDNFPPWSLEFYQPETIVFGSLLTSRRSIYFYMFLLIGGILIFGLILSIRSVSHELELSRMKYDFVSTISHEIKSPLTSIRQISEMLQSGRQPSKERKQQYYDVLVDQSERLSLLIDNILDFSKMEDGKRLFRFEWVDTESFLKEIAEAFEHRIRHEGFSLRIEIQRPIRGLKIDKSAMTQAITNIMDNAVKFSTNRKEIVILGFQDDQCVNISVQDFGMGMKTEEMDKIFDRFYRGGDDLARTIRGSGLGLTLVKQIVEAHHGRVEVKSVLGKGSTFTIRLPFQFSDDRPQESNHRK
ncbi:hypothetical protein JW824_04930 [bacterium]|nr:hypothetical protein [bacterium]RQV92925.1 MAG: hypothetical protein EH221_10640 [bacterium]